MRFFYVSSRVGKWDWARQSWVFSLSAKGLGRGVSGVMWSFWLSDCLSLVLPLSRVAREWNSPWRGSEAEATECGVLRAWRRLAWRRLAWRRLARAASPPATITGRALCPRPSRCLPIRGAPHAGSAPARPSLGRPCRPPPPPGLTPVGGREGVPMSLNVILGRRGLYLEKKHYGVIGQP